MSLVVLLGIATATHFTLTFAVVRRLRALEAGRVTVERWPPVGTVVADFSIQTLHGSGTSYEDLRAGEQVAVFVKAGCGPCDDLAHKLDELLPMAQVPAHFFVVGDPADPRTGTMAERLSGLGVVTMIGAGTEVTAAFGGVRTFPALIHLRDGIITASGADPARVLPRTSELAR